MTFNEEGDFSCTSTSSVLEAIVCPFGFRKRSHEEVLEGCLEAGLPCHDDFDCVCDPCEEICSENALPTSDGGCRCISGYIEFGGSTCQPVYVLAITVVIPVILFVTIIVLYAMRYQRRKADMLWHIHPYDLKFDEPVEVLGIGSFGVVVKAEYRGTSVAVKRVGPPEGHKRLRYHASRKTREKQGVLSPEILHGIHTLESGTSASTNRSRVKSKRSRRAMKSSTLQTKWAKEKKALEYMAEVIAAYFNYRGMIPIPFVISWFWSRC